MQVSRQKITDKTLIEVQNDAFGIVGYSTDRVKRDFPVGSTKKVEFQELLDLISSPGGHVLLAEGKLLIKDPDARELLDLPEIGDYNLTRALAVELLKSEDTTRLEDVLKYCSNSSLQKLVEEAINTKIKSTIQANLIKSYTGIDVLSIIEESSDEEGGPNTGSPKGKEARHKIVK